MEKMKKETLYDLKNVSQPKSHGDLVFYLETQIDKEENGYVTTLHSIHTQTKERKKWGDKGTVQTAIDISPNGKWLSYLSNDAKDKKMQLMVMPLDGGGAMQLTSEEEGVSSYHWTANSAAVYYETSEERNSEKEKESFPKKRNA